MRQNLSMTLGNTGRKVVNSSSRCFAADNGCGLLSRKVLSRATVGSDFAVFPCVMR